jgi:tetratricopeptide (TPR) repeat protein
VVLFGPALRHPFITLDDDQYVYGNAYVVQGLTAKGIAWAFTSTQASNWHPVTWLSHMLDCQLYGLDPAGHHAGNVVLHAGTAALLFLVLWRMSGRLWPSAVVGALFAVHPLRVESVVWVAERKDVLSGLLFMLTLGAYALYVRRPSSVARYLAVWLLFALGLMAKPMLVTIPCLLLLLDYWPLGRFQPTGPSPRNPKRERGPGAAPSLTHRVTTVTSGREQADAAAPHARVWRLVLEKVPLFALSTASSLATLVAQREAAECFKSLPLGWRLANALVSYVSYLGKTFWPKSLAVVYPHPEDTLAAWQITGALLLLAGITAGAWLWRSERPYLIVGWLWFLGTLVPAIGLVQVGRQGMADRYTYLPQIGILIAVVWWAGDFLRKHAWGRHAWPIAAAVVIASLCVCTWQQISVWQDSERLFNHALEVVPRNGLAHYHLAGALCQTGELDEAAEHYEKAIEINPRYPEYPVNLGILRARQGKFEQAAKQFRRALAIAPDNVLAHFDLGLALQDQGKFDEAIAQYEEALRIAPTHADAHYNLATCLAKQGRQAEAAAHFQRAQEPGRHRKGARDGR